MKPTRWGICGTGWICGEFANALLHYLSPQDHKLLAVGSRCLQKAKDFAQKYNIEKAYGSYQEIADDENIDVVYIGTIHQTHYRLCRMMLEKRKNVLAEKPMTMNAKLAQELVDYAQKKNVFFMEGYWSRMFPIYEKIREELASGRLGDIIKVEGNFTFSFPELGWRAKRETGGGVMLILGVYLIQFALMVFNEDPEAIQAMAKMNDGGVDIATSIQLQFRGGRFAQLYCSLLEGGVSNARIIGTKGMIDIPVNLFAPTRAVMPPGTYDIPHPAGPNAPLFAGLSYEAEAVEACLLKGLKECPEVPLSDSVRIARICDEVRRQIGLVYNEDKQMKYAS